MARGNITLQKTIVAIINAGHKKNIKRKNRGAEIEGNNNSGNGGNFSTKTATSKQAGKNKS